MTENQELVPWKAAITHAKKHFNEIAKAEGNVVLYKKEAMFAMQAVQKSEYLQNCTPGSIQNAVINVASVGLTLNPANAYAYIVPRDGIACLDVSYKGMIKLATDSGSIQWVKSVLVYEDDQFEMRGIDQMPLHKYDPFKKERGDVIGGYCAAKLHDGTYMIDTMSRDELDQVRETSKAKNGPWKTWPLEMMKKTLIKRASKTWPNTNRLDKAVEIVNEHDGLEDQYLEGSYKQIDNTVVVDASLVLEAANNFKAWIDMDSIEDHHEEIKLAWNNLNNDERMRVNKMLSEKAPGSNKMYRRILTEYLDYHPADSEISQ